jgi:membrane protein required for colicin V production
MHFSQWTFLDFIFALIILVSTGFALTKGIVKEITSIVALIVGFVLAVIYYPNVARNLMAISRTDAVANLLGFMIIFLGCILIGAAIAFIVNRFIKAASLKWFDRLLGGIFGLLRGWAISSILVIAILSFPVSEDLMAKSYLAPYLLTGARAGVLVVPKSLKDKFYEQYRKVIQTWNQNRSAE